jgi:hypothetical protein
MGTTIPMRPKRGPRVRESVQSGGTGREAQYDLLTAALIGAAIGATATLLFSRGPSGQRPVVRGAKWAGRGAVAAGSAGAAGAEWAKERGEELLERIPTERIEHDLREARERIDGFVQSEIKDLRKALRRQRKRLGL